MQGYLSNPENAEKDLARFYYNDKEDMFDAVSYQKGGRILNMLRNFLGDSAFFKGLNNYLTTNKFKAAEAHQLRLAFEEVSGRDLNWFFNQWYFNNGHPKLNINYVYDDAAKVAKVIIEQTQDSSKLFKIPMAIDVYENGKKTRHMVTVSNQTDTFSFAYQKKPDLINVDADKVLLCEKDDHKTLEQYVYQYKNAGNYVDRREAIEFNAKNQGNAAAQNLLVQALNDPYHGLRKLALDKLDIKNTSVKTAAEKKIAEMAAKDPKTIVRASALEALAKYDNKSYLPVFLAGIKDSSYSVAGASLEGLAAIDNDAAVTATKQLAAKPAKGALLAAITSVSAKNGIEEALDPIINTFGQLPLSQTKFEMLQPLSQLLAKSKDPVKVKRGVDEIVAFRETIPANYRAQTDGYINNMILQGIQNAKQKENTSASLELVEYIKAKREGVKKGF
jgi:aminopeptidase N